MALYLYSLTHLTRAPQMPRASQAAAYILRQERAYNAEIAAYGWDARKLRPTYEEELTYATWGHLPAWSANNPVTFFAAADHYERANGRIASSLVVILPRELSHVYQQEILRDWCHLTYPTHPHVVAMHTTPAFDGDLNHHAHMLYSIRQTDAWDRGAAQHFARWKAHDPGQGGAQKDRAFDAYGLLRAHRYAWSDVVNWHLDRAHGQEFLDPRSLHGREIPRTPEPTLPSFHGIQAKHRGIISPEWQMILDHRQARRPLKPLEVEKAQEWWTYRKALLGHPGTQERMRAAVAANTALETRLFRHPTQVDLVPKDTPLERHVALLQAEVQEQARYRAMGKPLTPDMRSRAYRLALQTDLLARTAQAREGMHR